MYEASAHFRRGGFWLVCCSWSERTGPSRSDPIRSDGGSRDRRLMRRADRTSNPLISLLPIPAPGRCGKRNMMFTSTFCCKSCKCCNWLTGWLLRTGDCLKFEPQQQPNGRNGDVLLRGKVETLSRNFTLTEFCGGLPLLSCICKYIYFASTADLRHETPEGVVVFACFPSAC